MIGKHQAWTGGSRQSKAKGCKTSTQQDRNMSTNKAAWINFLHDPFLLVSTMDKTETSMDKTKQRKRGPCLGPTTDLAQDPSERKTKQKSESKGKTHANPKSVHKGRSKEHSSKARNSKTLEREREREKMD